LCTALHVIRILRRLQTRGDQRSSRIDLQQLPENSKLEPAIDIFKIQWRMPVSLNEINKLSLLCTLESGRYLNMGFRLWNLYEFPLLQRTSKHLWAIKTATQLKKPRYVVFALQVGRIYVRGRKPIRRLQIDQRETLFELECYPYDDMNLDFDKNR